MIEIPVVISAKNEAFALGACLDSLLVARRYAEERLSLRLDLVVVLDDCTDGSGEIARARGVRTLESSGGKVAAQRAGLRPSPFCIFSDADIAVAPDTLFALATVMLADPLAQVATPRRVPLAPMRRTLLARALYVYNLHRGFQSERTWFSGKLFAIRSWSIPTCAEVAERAARLPGDPFYELERGVFIDDIYLSRTIVEAHGPRALAESAEGCIYFRAPETWRGMYRYFRRMRREVERIDLLFPESRATHARFGRRHTDESKIADAPGLDRWLFRLFAVAVMGCRLLYRADRALTRHFLRVPRPDWIPILETKSPIDPRMLP